MRGSILGRASGRPTKTEATGRSAARHSVPAQLTTTGVMPDDRGPVGWLLFVIVAVGMLAPMGSTQYLHTNAYNSPGASSADDEKKDVSFQTDLFTGALKSVIPIELPPGRNNSTPKVDLVYNSRGANGWCGVGWDLDLGCIERNTKHGVPVKWNGASPLPSFDDSKGFRFRLNGTSSELVLVGSAGSSSTWRARIDGAFLSFQFASGTWTATGVDGTSYQFGTTTASRSENPAWTSSSVGDRTFQWALDRIVDSASNETTVAYTKDDGQVYPALLSWNGNVGQGYAPTHTLQFVLDTVVRSDKPLSFISGFHVRTGKRLKSLIAAVNGVPAKRYDIGWEESPSTGRSRIHSVQLVGSDGTTALPPWTFTYQDRSLAFDNPESWLNLSSQGQTAAGWNSPRSVNSEFDTNTALTDIDGDAIPDRVMRKFSSPYPEYPCLRGRPNGFAAGAAPYGWATLDSNGHSSSDSWNSINKQGQYITATQLIDLDGNGYPDRVMRLDAASQLNYFLVQLNDGLGFATPMNWNSLSHEFGYDNDLVVWNAPGGRQIELVGSQPVLAYVVTVNQLVDMDGDGLPDRVLTKKTSPYTEWRVQRNTGSAFEANVKSWGPLGGESGSTGPEWRGIFSQHSAAGEVGRTIAELTDLNGDGLPDRVMRKSTSPYDYFVVQFNNGYGFEPWEQWGPLNHDQGYTGLEWACPSSSPIDGGSPADGSSVRAMLVDVTGDGLPDRVLRSQGPRYDHFSIQVNLGSGFRSTLDTVSNVACESGPCGSLWGSIVGVTDDHDTVVDFLDIDGDGLRDRVMRKASAPYGSYFKVQRGSGSIPDVLTQSKNGFGGITSVTWMPSSRYDNHDALGTTDPWAQGARSLLPFVVQTVASMTRNDGITAPATTAYTYDGGMWDPARREFRGFYRVRETSPAGSETTTYFHQGGGIDGTSLGEFQDAGVDAKAGRPFRTEFRERVDQSLVLREIAIHKIECFTLNQAGWFWPFESQSVNQDFADNGQYRCTGHRTWRDPVTARVTRTAEYGEVDVSGNVTTHLISDINPLDSVFTQITYATLSNPNITDRRDAERITADEAGTGATLRETRYEWFGTTGQLKKTRKWLNLPIPRWIEDHATYDEWGNLKTTTDPRGTVTVATYDTTYHTFAEMRETTLSTQSGPTTLVAHATYSPLPGLPLTQTDEKGLLTRFTYDLLFRLTLREFFDAATSTYKPLEQYQYVLGGIVGGISGNALVTFTTDGVDAAGLEKRSYQNGFGRTLQVRAEAEGTNAYRVSGTVLDIEGNVSREIAPFLSSGAAFEAWPMGGAQPAASSDHDGLHRIVRRELPPTEAGAETGPTVITYGLGGDPWRVVSTDANGHVKETRLDAFGRTHAVVEAISTSLSTIYSYDRFGDLLEVVDVDGNATQHAYDSLGRRLSRNHPDSGVTTWAYDDMGAVVEAIDAEGRRVVTQYDGLGRTERQDAFEAGSSVAESNFTWTWDHPVTGDLVVLPTQLALATDDEGSTYFGYDVRGRVLEKRRLLDKTAGTYRTRMTYDDMNRQLTLSYPAPTNNITPVVAYSYDRAGHIVEARVTAGLGPGAPAGGEAVYEALGFTASDQLSSFANANGVTTDIDWYDHLKLPQRMHVYTATEDLQDLSYEYDAVGNVHSITDAVGVGPAAANLGNIQYDAANRLKSVTRGLDVFNFGYDNIGNVTLNQESGTGSYSYGATQPHAALSANGTAYAYDTCGNMTQRGSQTLVWDARQRLQEVDAGPDVTTFGYAFDGARLWRQDDSLNVWIGNTYEIHGTQRQCHVYVGSRRVATFVPSDLPISDGGGIGHHFHSVVIELPEQPIWYYHADHLGGTNLVTNRDGEVVQQAEYNTFGTTRYEASGANFATDNLFIGEVLDRTTGLYCLGSRYYDPALSRFTQVDPVEGVLNNPQSLNPYSYSQNNPLRYVDPSGAYPTDPDMGESGGLGDMLSDWGGWLYDNTIVGDVAEFMTPGMRNIYDWVEPKNGSYLDEAVSSVNNITLVALAATGLGEVGLLAEGGTALSAELFGAELEAAAAVGTEGALAEGGALAGGTSLAEGTAAAESGGGVSQLFRSVGEAERLSIETTGQYASKLGMSEGKYFYPTAEQAANFARMSFASQGVQTLTSVEVGSSILQSATPLYIAGEGAAFFISGSQLSGLGVPQIWSYFPIGGP